MFVFGAVVSFNHFWSPYFKPFVGTMGLSWVWAILYIGLALSAIIVRRLTIPQGQEATWIVASVVITGIGLAGAGLSSGLLMSLFMVTIHECGRGMLLPLVDSFVITISSSKDEPRDRSSSHLAHHPHRTEYAHNDQLCLVYVWIVLDGRSFDSVPCSSAKRIILKSSS